MNFVQIRELTFSNAYKEGDYKTANRAWNDLWNEHKVDVIRLYHLVNGFKEPTDALTVYYRKEGDKLGLFYETCCNNCVEHAEFLWELSKHIRNIKFNYLEEAFRYACIMEHIEMAEWIWDKFHAFLDMNQVFVELCKYQNIEHIINYPPKLFQSFIKGFLLGNQLNKQPTLSLKMIQWLNEKSPISFNATHLTKLIAGRCSLEVAQFVWHGMMDRNHGIAKIPESCWFYCAAQNCMLEVMKWLWSLSSNEYGYIKEYVYIAFESAMSKERIDICEWLKDKLDTSLLYRTYRVSKHNSYNFLHWVWKSYHDQKLMDTLFIRCFNTHQNRSFNMEHTVFWHFQDLFPGRYQIDYDERNHLIKAIILKKLTVIHDKTVKIEKEIECPVCQCATCNVSSACSHTFCYDCLNIWYQTNETCPMCRHPFEDCYKTI
jgi:hypothetical protein